MTQTLAKSKSLASLCIADKETQAATNDMRTHPSISGKRVTAHHRIPAATRSVRTITQHQTTNTGVNSCLTPQGEEPVVTGLAPPTLSNPQATPTETSEGDGDLKTGNTCNALSGESALDMNAGICRHSDSPPSLVTLRCLLRCLQHLQFLGRESGGWSVPGGPQLQPRFASASQHPAAQHEPAAAQPPGCPPGPTAETAQ